MHMMNREFQYNFCYCSMSECAKSEFDKGMFQYNFCYCSINRAMDLFLQGYSFQYNFCYCSIRTRALCAYFRRRFQYNFCYCSMRQLTCKKSANGCFNTTFVTVLSTIIRAGRPSRGVSIQLLLLFYPLARYVRLLSASFQYNFCYCSIHIPKDFIPSHSCFNTTFVTVLFSQIFKY